MVFVDLCQRLRTARPEYGRMDPRVIKGIGPASSPRPDREARLIESVLRGLTLFRQVAPEHFDSVARHSYTVSARRGEVLCERGHPLSGVYTVAFGAAQLALRRPGYEEKVVRFLGPGDSFGEFAALQARPSPVALSALQDSSFVVMPPLVLLSLIERDHQFARNLVRTLAEKFFVLLDEVEATAQMTAIERLARYLAELARPGGAERRGWVALLPTSKSGVAARLGITKETMSRLLRELASRGLIQVDGREILVPDPTALATLAR